MAPSEGAKQPIMAAVVRRQMAFERAFVAAGGKLMAGVDRTRWAGVVAGFGDQREVELLVEAGFAAGGAWPWPRRVAIAQEGLRNRRDRRPRASFASSSWRSSTTDQMTRYERDASRPPE
jgi:hypothetical protein